MTEDVGERAMEGSRTGIDSDANLEVHEPRRPMQPDKTHPTEKREGRHDIGLRSALETLSLIVGPTTLVAALLLYFGWIRTNAVYGYFNIDTSILGFSSQDYILHSIGAVWSALIVTLTVALALVWGHRWLHGLDIGRHRHGLKAVSRLMMVGGMLLTAFALISVTGVLDHVSIVGQAFSARFVTPVTVILGPAMVSYGFHVRRLTMDPASREEPRWHSTVTLTLVMLIVAFGLVSLFGDWAAYTTHRYMIATNVACDYFGVVLYSNQQLHVDAKGVTEEDAGPNHSAYRFRYAGLVLLIRSGERFFLLPKKWSFSSGRAIVLRDNDTLRLEYEPPQCES